MARAMILGKPFQLFLAVAGIALGVCAVTVINSLSTGFSGAFLGKILDNMGHVVVTGQGGLITSAAQLVEKIEAMPEISGAALFNEGQALLEYRGILSGVRIYGVEPRIWSSVLPANRLVEGSRENGLLIGRVLAGELGVKTGDLIRLSVMDGSTFIRIAGIFTTGMQDYDSSVTYIPMDQLSRLMDLPEEGVNVMIRCMDQDRAGDIAKKITEFGGGLLRARPWQETNASLVMAFRIERRLMSIVGFLAVLIAVFGSCSLLSVIVSERRREIAYGRAMGISSRSIALAFMVTGLFIGGAGALLGSAAGVAIAMTLRKWPITIPGDVYFISTLPVKIDYSDIFLTLVVAMILALLAALLPALKAASTDPVRTLRGES